MHGVPIAAIAASSPSREVTSANSGTGMPVSWNRVFSARRSWIRASARGFGNTGTRSLSHCADSARSEEHTSELQSLMRISYAVFCLKKKTQSKNQIAHTPIYHNNKET